MHGEASWGQKGEAAPVLGPLRDRGQCGGHHRPGLAEHGWEVGPARGRLLSVPAEFEWQGWKQI